jgi:hypothetical protein
VVCFEYKPRTLAQWLRKVDAFRLFRQIYHDALSRIWG